MIRTTYRASVSEAETKYTNIRRWWITLYIHHMLRAMKFNGCKSPKHMIKKQTIWENASEYIDGTDHLHTILHRNWPCSWNMEMCRRTYTIDHEFMNKCVDRTIHTGVVANMIWVHAGLLLLLSLHRKPIQVPRIPIQFNFNLFVIWLDVICSLDRTATVVHWSNRALCRMFHNIGHAPSNTKSLIESTKRTLQLCVGVSGIECSGGIELKQKIINISTIRCACTRFGRHIRNSRVYAL